MRIEIKSVFRQKMALLSLVTLVVVISSSMKFVTLTSKSSNTKTINASVTSVATQGKITFEAVAFYKYMPQSDITSYELSLLLPLFSGPYYGFGEYSTGGNLVPIKDRNKGGWPADSTIPILRLNEYEFNKLGTAKRHLVKLP